jgi:chaperone modulatory protein CbpM
MIRETELIAQFTYLEREVLLTWIEEGVIAPRRDEEGYLFDRVDESRVALACDLHYRMGLDHASLSVILSLIDQLHEVRHNLRTLTRAVAEQPEAIQQQIRGRMTGDRLSTTPEPENVMCKAWRRLVEASRPR